MVDAATKKTVAAIPQHKTKAGPRDGDQWVIRLKEEYMSLIKVLRFLSYKDLGHSYYFFVSINTFCGAIRIIESSNITNVIMVLIINSVFSQTKSKGCHNMGWL